MKNKKTFLKIIIFIFCITLIPTVKANTNINQYYNVDISQKVYDYANLFTNEEEKELYDYIKATTNKYDTEVLITTINDNPELNTQIFAENFYDNNNFGKGEDKEGILLVIDMEKREYYIVTTGNTIKIINDMRIEKILDAMENNMINGDYYNAAKSFINKTNKYYSYHKYGPPLLWLSTIIVAILFGLIMLNKEKKKLKLITDHLEASNYIQDKTIEHQTDTLVNTTSRVIVHSSSSGSSSGRSSGGGRSHGGGGRRF